MTITTDTTTAEKITTEKITAETNAAAATSPIAAARLEHVNLTVSSPERTAAMLVDVFGWHVRWAGDSIHGGRTIHVGTEDDYLALYTMPHAARPTTHAETDIDANYGSVGGLNHVALVVTDLDEAERRVIAAGYEPGNHYDYEPGRRFYFYDHDGIEFEIVSYS